MVKRVLCFFLSAVMVFGLCAMATPQVAAAEDLKTSENCIALIKEFEGFSAKAVSDYAQYSIGYGSACQKDEYPNGITKEKADELLRAELVKIEPYVNKFASRYGLALSQQQFDALISFTYNLGTNWMNNASTFRTAVINGSKGNDFIFAMTMWCNAGGSIVTGLVQRRLAEANLYLNGVYAKLPPSNYRYVIFDNNLESAVTTVKIQGFDANLTDVFRATPTKSGYRFLGWYTKADGGAWLSKVGSGVSSGTLYAHWQSSDADASGAVKASYTRYATIDQPLLDAPGGKEVKKLDGGTKLTVTADYLDASGNKWAKVSGGWVELSKTQESKEEAAGQAVDLKVTVLSSGVNIRSGPGTSHKKAGTATRGQELQLTRIQQGGNYLWGQFSGGWICLDYTDYDTVSAEESGDANKVTATGVITGTNKLNVRARPSASSAKVGEYTKGTKVQITLQQKVGNTTWGKTEKGWISLYYVKLSAAEEDATIATTAPTTAPTTPAATEPAATQPAPTAPAPTEPAPTEPATNTVIATGKITGCTTLRVRSGAGTKYSKVGSLSAGTKVSIYETLKVGVQIWGRIDKGWICMTYVKLDSANSGSNSTTTSSTGTIVNCTNLNVRAGAGTTYAGVGKIAKGTMVKILETAMVGNTTWGRIDKGWISLYYVKLDGKLPESGTTTQPENSGNSGTTTTPGAGTTTTPSTGTTTPVNKLGTITGTGEVRLRSEPGTGSKQVGTMKKGERVVILETTKVGNATWGKTEKGWVHMYYVKLDSSEVPAGSIVRTVTTKLNIRAGAGTSYATVGSYLRGAQVVITAQTNVNGTQWGRTDKGWISMDYVK